MEIFSSANILIVIILFFLLCLCFFYIYNCHDISLRVGRIFLFFSFLFDRVESSILKNYTCRRDISCRTFSIGLVSELVGQSSIPIRKPVTLLSMSTAIFSIFPFFFSPFFPHLPRFQPPLPRRLISFPLSFPRHSTTGEEAAS